MNQPDHGRSSSSPRAEAAIAKAAGDWVARLDRGLSPAEAAQLAAWEAADPRNAAELARLHRTWSALDTADEVPEIMAMARDIDEAHERSLRVRRRLPWALGGLSAAAAVALLWITAGQRPGTAPAAPVNALAEIRSYKVVPSSAQRLTLADGTIVELNAQSAVEPAFTAAERRVRVVRGEAHFQVAKDAARPFSVQAGTVVVRAVGTAFNVRLAPESVEVLVTEGRVRVLDANQGASLLPRPEAAAAAPLPAAEETPVLVAGQRVVIPTHSLAPVAPVEATADDIERALAWQGTRLVFERTPLEEAVAAFNSFNRRQLVIGEAAIRPRRLGGTFRADNLDAFVRLLESGFEISAERRGEDEIVLRGAR